MTLPTELSIELTVTLREALSQGLVGMGVGQCVHKKSCAATGVTQGKFLGVVEGISGFCWRDYVDTDESYEARYQRALWHRYHKHDKATVLSECPPSVTSSVVITAVEALMDW